MWNLRRRTPARITRAHLTEQTRRLGCRHTVDLVALVGLGLVLALLGSGWFVGITLSERLGWFAPPLVQPLPDERILTNVRDNLTENPLVEAVFHPADATLYLAQQGGTIHRYHAPTGLWASERPFTLANENIIALRSGCGSDPASDYPCAEAESLWGLTADGGLVRRYGGAWQVIAGDTAFRGVDGTPIETDQLTAAAVSDDNEWLVAGTGGQGIGIYHIPERRWLHLSPDFFQNLASVSVTDIVFWDGYFWIGGPQGVSIVSLVNGLPNPIRPWTGRDVIDLTAAPGEGVWALSYRRCVTSGSQQCLHLERYRTPTTPPDVLLSERDHFPDLTLEDLTFAHQTGNRLILAGRAGIYGYDTATHSWQQLFDRPVTAAVAGADETANTVYFGFSDGVGRLQGSQVETWPTSGKRVVRLLEHTPGVVMALTSDGEVFEVRPYPVAAETPTPTPADEITRVFAGRPATLQDPAAFRAAFAYDDTVFMVGPDGVLLHDITARTYDFVRAENDLSWLGDPRVQFVPADRYVYVFGPPQGQSSQVPVRRLLISQASDASRFLSAADVSVSYRLDRPIRQTWGWGESTIGLMTGNHAVYQLTPTTLKRHIDEADPSLTLDAINDVTGVGPDMVAAFDTTLQRYYTRGRRWINLATFPRNDSPVEVATYLTGLGTSHIVVRTAQGHLIQVSGSHMDDPDVEVESLIGGSRMGLTLGDAALSDVVRQDEVLYLGGAGRVEAYDLTARRVTHRWQMGERGRVQLKAIFDERPLAHLDADAFYWGERRVEPDVGRVKNVSVDAQNAWTVRHTDPDFHLRRYVLTGTLPLAGCYFRQPWLDGGQITDARPLANDLVAVTTAQGVSLYSPERRTWIPVEPTAAITVPPQRIYNVGDAVLLAADLPDGMVQLTRWEQPTASPDFCGNTPVPFGEPTTTITARAYAVDEANKKFAWIDPDGRVMERHDEVRREVLAETHSGPAPESLRRAYRIEDLLLFTTATSLWTYNLDNHQWQERRLNFGANTPPLTDINLEPGAEQTVVIIARANSGDIYQGLLLDVAQRDIVMQPVYRANPNPTVPDPALLVDVVQVGENWAFVFQDRVRYYNPTTRLWLREAQFAQLDPARTVYELGGRVIISDGDTWRVAMEPGTAPTRFVDYQPLPNEITAISPAGDIWRVAAGVLYRCPAVVGQPYTCQPITETPRPLADLLDNELLPLYYAWLILAGLFIGLTVMFIGVWLAMRLSNWDGRSVMLLNGLGLAFVLVLIIISIALASPTLVQVRLVNGQWLHNPVTTIIRNELGLLVAVQPSRRQFLGVAGTVQARPAPALDAGWLRWQPDARVFQVRTPNDTLQLSPADFMPHNHLLFEPIEAVLPVRGRYAASEHGLWHFPAGSLSLTDPAITFQPLRLTLPTPALRASASVTAAHGRFLTANGSVAPGETERQPLETEFVVEVGGATLTEAMYQRTVTSTLFSRDGFLWDRNRRGLAYTADGLIIQSDAGIHPITTLDWFDMGTDGSNAGQLHGEAGRLLYERGGRWSERTAQGWISTDDPTQTRDLFATAEWAWRLAEGALRVRLDESAEPLPTTRDGNRFSFDADRLVDAVLYQGALYLLTEHSVELAANAAILDTRRVVRLPHRDIAPQRTGNHRLELVEDGAVLLYHQDDTRWRWEAETARFIRDESHVYTARPMVTTPRLRFTQHAGQVIKEMRVRDMHSGERWVPFDFVDGSFPFDVVTAVAVHENQLYVGTPAGLQIYPTLDTSLAGDAPAFLTWGQPIERLSIPVDDPDVLRIYTGETCFEQQPGSGYEPCQTHAPRPDRLRLANALWRWRVGPDGGLVGDYRTQDGQYIPDSVTIADGHFTHDRLRDVAVCDGQAFSIWESGWLTVHATDDMNLFEGFANLDVSDWEPQRFLCLADDTLLISAGLYVQGSDTRFWRYTGLDWQPVTLPDVIVALQSRLAQPPVFEDDRFRLRTPLPGEPYRFEHRTMAGDWRSLEWVENAVAIDLWHDFISIDGDIWAATAAGLVRFDQRFDGQLVLDTDSTAIVPEPRVDGKLCDITEVASLDGQTLVRCAHASSMVYAGVLSATVDADVFSPYPGPDPFAAQTLVATEDWTWQLTGKRDGDPGVLSGQLRDEPVRMLGGRFDFDSLTSIALFEDGVLDIGTQTGGWYQTPRTDLSVRQWRRPDIPGVNARAVDAVRVTRSGGQEYLCLRRPTGEYIRLRAGEPPETVAQCPIYMGDDGFWAYERTDAGLEIATPGTVGQRALVAGRFTDDIVRGLPVTGQDDDGVVYLLPTAAGILQLDPRLRNSSLQSPPFAPPAGDTVPDKLFLREDGTLAYVVENEIYAGGNLLGQIAIPNEAELLSLRPGPQDFIRLDWEQSGQRGWTLVRPDDFVPLMNNDLPLDVSQFDPIVRRELSDRWLQLGFSREGVAARLGDRPPYRVPIFADVLTPAIHGDRLFVIGRRSLTEVNLERLLTDMVN